MTTNDKREILLTPGPLTTTETVREAMMKDWGSRDANFIALTARVRERLVDIAGGGADLAAVPLQGSGTFALEAAVGTFVPRDGKLLVVINGAYGHRIAQIAEILGRSVTMLETAEDDPSDPDDVAAVLAHDPDITHVFQVHCETTSGILNPIAEIAAVVAAAGRTLMIDAMSTFGALPLDLGDIPADVVVASSNKCLEGVPGVGFVVARQSALEAAEGNAPSLSLDLVGQWRGFEKSGEWRFTPPTHVVAAFDRALEEHTEEGGVAARGARYSENCRVLVEGMRGLGFETYLPDGLQAPIIVTFNEPGDPVYDFGAFYDALGERGVVIYPGKLTKAPSFRMGCIGALDTMDMRRAVAAVKDVMAEMGMKTGA